MKILIFIDQFSTGGGARVVSRLLEGFVSVGYDVVLATKLQKEHYPIPKEVIVESFDVPRHSIKLMSMFQVHLSGTKLCRRICKKYHPDVVIGEMSITYLWAYLGTRGLGVPVIAHDHTSFSRKINPLTDFIRNRLYGLADALVILTERDRKILNDKFPRKIVINNPLPFEPLKEVPTNQRKSILCVGRFDVWDVKGFDIIIDIFSRLSIKFPDWKLEFAGTGTNKSVEYIKKLVEHSGLNEENVIFHGQVSDIKSLYQQVQIFALPSRVEGMPMGLMEAMSQGCACIAFEVGGATKEMLNDGESGYCITDGDVNGFANKLEKLMSFNDLRTTFCANAIISSQKYSLCSIMNKWIQLFNKINK